VKERTKERKKERKGEIGSVVEIGINCQNMALLKARSTRATSRCGLQSNKMFTRAT